MGTGTADKTIQDTGKAEAPGAGLEGKEGGAETKPEKTYRQSEVDALLGKAGQKKQSQLEAITTERDTLKSQLESLTAEITEARESIISLTKDIETMSEDNPDKDALVKLRKEREKELKALKAERAEIAPAKLEIAKWNRDQLVYTVADEFVTSDGKDVDPDTFMKAADKFNLSKREELEALAEEKGFKTKEEVQEKAEPEVPPVKPYSGKTEGGGQLTEQDKLKRRYPTMNK